MDGTIKLHGRQRQRLLELYRVHGDPEQRLRAHIILLLAEGHPWALISAVLFCSTATIARWKDRFVEEGVAGLVGQARGHQPILFRAWAATAAGWVRHYRPSDFGFRRSRWCCATVVVLMLELHRVKLSAETVRRWLHREHLVWRRPRPVLGPKDPEYAVKVAHLRWVLRHLPPDETAVFMDEVDINTNPKVGCQWMPRGQQATVETPGTNSKRYLAGSLHWRIGTLLATPRRQARRSPVRRPPRRPAPPLSLLPKGPRPLRPCRVPQAGRRRPLPAVMGPPHPVALPAPLCTPDQPHRTHRVETP
jgi:transposase